MTKLVICGVSLLVGLLTCQLPEFAQQYRQRLDGTVNEMQRVVARFDEDVARSRYDRTAALKLMADNPQQLIRDQGIRMEENIYRLIRLRAQQESFARSGTLLRLVAFFREFDPELTQQTLNSYEMALPFSFEGIFCAVSGFVLAAILLTALFGAGRRLQPA